MKHVFIFLLLSMCLHVHGVFDADTEEVSVMEGDSVTLNTGVQRNQQEEIKWYFEDIRIALITGDLSYICTDVQCNEGTERFRDRLKLDHQTGSLTITNTRITHSGDYELVIISSSSFWGHKKIFRVSVYGVFDVDTEEVSVKEGDSVTLYTGVQRNQQEEIKWYFKYIRIAQITGDLSYICTDVQCNEGTERFRDRLKLDHQTGSLTITNTRITDSGDYDLMIISSSSFWGHENIFRVSVLESDSGLSPDVLTGIFVAVVVLLNVAGAAGLIYCCKRQARRRGIRTEHNDQANGVADSSPGLNDTLLMETIRDSSPNQDEPANDAPT